MKKLLTAALGLVLVALTAPHALAGFCFHCCHGCCNDCATICCKQYNAFTPACFGTICCNGCCPIAYGCCGPNAPGPMGCGPMGCGPMCGGPMCGGPDCYGPTCGGPDCGYGGQGYLGQLPAPAAPYTGGAPMPNPTPSPAPNFPPPPTPSPTGSSPMSQVMPLPQGLVQPAAYSPYNYGYGYVPNYGGAYGYPAAVPAAYNYGYGPMMPQGYAPPSWNSGR